MDSARPHQRRFRRKFKLLTLRGRHTRNGSGSPENGDSNPLITNDTNDERSGEDTKEPSARFQPSEASQAIPRIQVELPPPTLTEQKLAQLKLEKTLLIQARHLVAAVHADLGFSMNRFEVCTSLLAARPDRSAPEGHTPPVYVTRTTVTPPTVGPEQPVGWRVVMQGNGVFYSAVDSLEAFVSELRVRLEHRAAEYGPYLNGV